MQRGISMRSLFLTSAGCCPSETGVACPIQSLQFCSNRPSGTAVWHVNGTISDIQVMLITEEPLAMSPAMAVSCARKAFRRAE